MGMLRTGRLGASGTGAASYEEFAAVEAKVEQARIAADNKVSKSGDTMSGTLSAPKFGGILFKDTAATATTSLTRCSVNVATWMGLVLGETAGSLVMKLPGTGMGTILNITLSVGNYLGTSASNNLCALVHLGGYLSAAPAWHKATAFVSNGNVVSRVRFVCLDGEFYVVFDSPSATWWRPFVCVHQVFQGIAASRDLTAGWTFELTADPPSGANDVIAPINSGLVPAEGRAPVARGYLNGSTGAFALKFGDIAVTRISTGVYSVTSGTLTSLHPQFFPNTEARLNVAYSGSAASGYVSRIWDANGDPADASGELFVWV